MDKRIKEKLDEFGFTIEQLTTEELEQLKAEIEFEKKGGVILDGVLANKPRYK